MLLPAQPAGASNGAIRVHEQFERRTMICIEFNRSRRGGLPFGTVGLASALLRAAIWRSETLTPWGYFYSSSSAHTLRPACVVIAAISWTIVR